MARQPISHQIKGFYNRARAIVPVVFIVIAAAPSAVRSQILQGDTGLRGTPSSSLANIAVSRPVPPLLLATHPLPASELSLPGVRGSIAALSVRPPLIVVGFAGGFIRSTSSVHGEVELAIRLRKQYGSEIHAEVFENHNGNAAYREILRLVGASNRGSPAAKKKAARIVLYGHSWGASEAVVVARQLQRHGIPVLLIVQVDGVSKGGKNDSVIPSNVAQAINFYQSDGLLHGRSMIYAADPEATKILGNFRFTYKAKSIPCPGYPWYARAFTKPHIEIENDPRVWNDVEALILSKASPQGF